MVKESGYVDAYWEGAVTEPIDPSQLAKESYFNDSAEKNKERLLYSAEFMSGGKESVDESESLSKMVWNFGVEI